MLMKISLIVFSYEIERISKIMLRVNKYMGKSMHSLFIGAKKR